MSQPETSEATGFDEEGRSEGAAVPTGHDVIRSYLKTLDDRPGVYRMLDAKSDVLYVGKARSLRKRVANYANPQGHSPRISRMIASTAAMMFLTTETETEALLLEQNLIKQLKPKYNVLLRDDKSFPYIFISTETDFPRIEKHRGAKTRKGHYFGPFASAGAVNRTLNTLQKVFLLRSCTDREVEAGDRPCLNYHLKRCAGPCGGKISKEDYGKLVKASLDFLTGRSTQAQEQLQKQMVEASAAMEFERAAALRDRIRAMAHVQSAQGVNPRTVKEADVIALHQQDGQACVEVFFFRANQNWGNRAYFPRTAGVDDPAELLEAFMGQFYATKDPPRLILMSHPLEQPELMAEALTERLGRKVEISVPLRGEKHLLVDHAVRNAQEALGRRMAESATQKKLLDGMATAFKLPKAPERIEVYDNSHIQGTDAVGGMIVAGAEGFLKSSYRKFNIRGTEITPGDDFGMMKEVLDRRFARLMKEDPERKSDQWPDLVLIDGGAGQVSAAAAALGDLGVQGVEIVGVAKGTDRDAGKEEFYRPGIRQPFALPFRDPVLYFVQRLRDEAHRFAIGTHRAKRAKATTRTPLDEIPGVGATRKRALLTHFGSAKAVSRAGLADLKSVPGISEAMAETIYGFFHGER